MSRSWSTKTLARELVKFLKAQDVDPEATIQQLLQLLKDQIVADEVGEDLEL